MLKKIFFCCKLPSALLIPAFVFVACSGFPATAKAADDYKYPKMVVQIGHNDPDTPDNHFQYYGTQFRDMIAERSKGAIEVQIYPSSQLGGERDLIEGMQLGTNDMAMVTGVNIGIFWPEYMVFDLPYLFADLQEAYKVLDSIGVEINQRLYEGLNIKVLSNGIGGFRHVGNNLRPIKHVADMKGMKIRTPEQRLYMETFKALGANPTPMAWAEVFTGMQQHTIDAYECPTSIHYTNRLYEASKYYSATKHFFSPVAMMISGRLWDSMDEKTRQLFIECSQEVAKKQRAFVAANEEKQQQGLRDNGMQVNTDVDIEEFRKVVASIWTMFRKDIGGALVDSVIAKIKE
ncbi:ABC transporter substrate-binding protein [Deltaproteobacteria bacterium]|nr:ABC transporter substrate-binding protein [Deltaproteobacteria bacterium]